jgi:hypothetical protein
MEYIVIRARAKPEHIAKLDSLSRATGLTHSQLLRLFVERAELHSAPAISVDLSAKHNGSAPVYQTQRTAIAA